MKRKKLKANYKLVIVGKLNAAFSTHYIYPEQVNSIKIRKKKLSIYELDITNKPMVVDSILLNEISYLRFEERR